MDLMQIGRIGPTKQKRITGLAAGTYKFQVRGKNDYGHLGREETFSFTILPPWYQTWWALLVYVLFAGWIIFGIVKNRVRHLEKKTTELEASVAERTSVIREQAEKLKDLDKMKSRFFANISHEFRTPLTLILGPLEERVARARNKTDKEELGAMRRNANRLLNLVNQLLDLSRLESGKMKLNASRGDFIAFLKGIVMSFASLAEQKKIALKMELPRHFESAGELAGQSAGELPEREFSEIYFDPTKSKRYSLICCRMR